MEAELKERAARALWDGEPGGHKFLARGGYAIDWDSQPASVKVDYYRRVQIVSDVLLDKDAPCRAGSKEQVTAAFKRDLQLLLDRYGAELEAKDHWQGYAECGEDVRMTVVVPAIYDNNHDCVREWTEIDLGSFWIARKPPQQESKT